MPLEKWQEVWRKGFAPFMPTEGLKALSDALAENDPQLISGSTTLPPPSENWAHYPIEAACAIGYIGWKGKDLQTIGECEEWFANMCFECNRVLGEPSACRWFLNWFDETPREEMIPKLLTEVNAELLKREMEKDTKELYKILKQNDKREPKTNKAFD